MNSTITSASSLNFLKLLAHDVRWRLLTLLARSDYRVQELILLVDQPQNLVSYHLRQLRLQQIVTERRSAADGRDIYYSLDLDLFYRHYMKAAGTLHPAFGDPQVTQEQRAEFLRKPARVLFLCTANSARSQMAEGLLRHLSKGKIEAYSAGSHPTHIHLYAIKAMASAGIDISQQQSKHFSEFLGQSFDRIITVCDRIREACPTFPGDPERIHWSFPDPVAVEGTEDEQYRVFEQIMFQLTNRIRLLITLLERERGGTQ